MSNKRNTTKHKKQHELEELQEIKNQEIQESKDIIKLDESQKAKKSTQYKIKGIQNIQGGLRKQKANEIKETPNI